MDDTERLAMAERFIAAIPHARALGMRIDEIGAGRAVLSMPWAPELVGDPATGVIHGGAVSALMDTCCGAAVMAHPAVTQVTATLDLRIEYMRGARPGQRIRAEALCHHVTRSVAFVRATATDDDPTGPVAAATGAFTAAAAPAGTAGTGEGTA
ncbi:PaaI family thioesterase [Frigidibacter sp. MR17.24]|uniref:PaaI family thioesterase n=1 Tax=Frigidibacter sp. MR17.24 TaxID=3127345 RepID=UPI003012BD6D